MLNFVKKWMETRGLPAEPAVAADTAAIPAKSAADPVVANVVAPAVETPAPTRAPIAKDPWANGRLAVAEQLWGDGWLAPAPIGWLNVVAGLGLPRAGGLVLLNAALGAAGEAVLRKTPITLYAYDPSPTAVAENKARRQGWPPRALIDVRLWQPEALASLPSPAHAAVVLPGLFRTADKEVWLRTLKKMLAPNASLLLWDLVVPPDNIDSKSTRSWVLLEEPRPILWNKDEMLKVLGEVGFGQITTQDDTAAYVKALAQAVSRVPADSSAALRDELQRLLKLLELLATKQLYCQRYSGRLLG